MIRSVTTAEPRFTEQDRAELFALAAHREGLCPLCHRPLEVCTSDEALPSSPKFKAFWRTCRATRAVAEYQNGIYTADNHPYRAAHLWGSEIKG